MTCYEDTHLAYPQRIPFIIGIAEIKDPKFSGLSYEFYMYAANLEADMRQWNERRVPGRKSRAQPDQHFNTLKHSRFFEYVWWDM